MFRPPQLFRIIEPLSGLPRITIRMRPTHRPTASDHPALAGQQSHPLFRRRRVDPPDHRCAAVLIDSEAPSCSRGRCTWCSAPTSRSRAICDDLPRIRRPHPRLLEEWVRRLSISYDWQEADHPRRDHAQAFATSRRPAAIVAAHTTSIPEAPGSGRTWDYRYLLAARRLFRRQALNRIGATRTMEDSSPSSWHRRRLRRRAAAALQHRADRPDGGAHRADLEGYRGDGPVRIGNAAAVQIQHDAYGSIILAATPMFFDQRLPRPGDEDLFRLLETLGEKARRAGVRARCRHLGIPRPQRVHTHSAAMCWAGCHRLASHRGAARPRRSRRATGTRIADDRSRAARAGLEPEAQGASRAASARDDLDASVLLLPELGVLEADDPRFVSTVDAMERELLREKHVMRYASADDFGMPETAFLICRSG